eukprot:3263283-Prymnesium_polylepis.2
MGAGDRAGDGLGARGDVDWRGHSARRANGVLGNLAVASALSRLWRAHEMWRRSPRPCARESPHADVADAQQEHTRTQIPWVLCVGGCVRLWGDRLRATYFSRAPAKSLST